MAFDALSQSGFAAIEVASDGTERIDAQCDCLVGDPRTCSGEVALRAGREQCGLGDGELQAGFFDELLKRLA